MILVFRPEHDNFKHPYLFILNLAYNANLWFLSTSELVNTSIATDSWVLIYVEILVALNVLRLLASSVVDIMHPWQQSITVDV